MSLHLDIEQRARINRSLSLDEAMRITFIEILMADEAIRYLEGDQYSIDYTQSDMPELNRLINGPYEDTDVCLLP